LGPLREVGEERHQRDAGVTFSVLVVLTAGKSVSLSHTLCYPQPVWDNFLLTDISPMIN